MWERLIKKQNLSGQRTWHFSGGSPAAGTCQSCLLGRCVSPVRSALVLPQGDKCGCRCVRAKWEEKDPSVTVLCWIFWFDLPILTEVIELKPDSQLCPEFLIPESLWFSLSKKFTLARWGGYLPGFTDFGRRSGVCFLYMLLSNTSTLHLTYQRYWGPLWSLWHQPARTLTCSAPPAPCGLSYFLLSNCLSVFKLLFISLVYSWLVLFVFLSLG